MSKNWTDSMLSIVNELEYRTGNPLLPPKDKRISYRQLYLDMGPDGIWPRVVGISLGLIVDLCFYESLKPLKQDEKRPYARRLPLPSAMVVNAKDREPGSGFAVEVEACDPSFDMNDWNHELQKASQMAAEDFEELRRRIDANREYNFCRFLIDQQQKRQQADHSK